MGEKSSHDDTVFVVTGGREVAMIPFRRPDPVRDISAGAFHS